MQRRFAAEDWKSSFRHDLLASVVVFLVALPLCMGIAIASGVPPALGIVTGIIGGIVVGSLAGSPLQVSGPAAGLAVIVWEIIQVHGMKMLGIIVLAAGAIQLVAGLLKLGQWFRAVSPAVIHGMLAGIGVLILLSQFHVMLDASPRGSGLANLIAIPDTVWLAISPATGATHHLAAAVGFLSIATLVGWNALAPKSLKVIPAPLLAVLVGVGVAVMFRLPINYVEIPANLAQALSFPSWGEVARLTEVGVIVSILTVAVVASAETLLCATAVDKMHSGPRTDYNRELTAQGVGNTLCGLVGALPMTGVIVRSTANVNAGGRTRASAILHGVWLLLFVAVLPFALALIPVASLAAILVYTGYKLVNPVSIAGLWRYGKSEVAIYMITMGAIVATNLLEGVLIGLGAAILKLLYTVTHLEVRMVDDPQQNRSHLHLSGSATFLRLPKLAQALERVRPDTELHVHFENLAYIDHAMLELLMSWEKQHHALGGSLVIEWNELQSKYHQRRPSRITMLAEEVAPERRKP